jgi:hypothetical protein
MDPVPELTPILPQPWITPSLFEDKPEWVIDEKCAFILFLSFKLIHLEKQDVRTILEDNQLYPGV